MFEYGPAEATAIQRLHNLLRHLNPDWFRLSGTGLTRLCWKRGRLICWQVGRPLSWPPGRARSGELLLSIGHQPGAVDKLTVVVLKARNLPSASDAANGCVASALTGALSALNPA